MWGKPPSAVRSSEARRLLRLNFETVSVSQGPALTISPQTARIIEVTSTRTVVSPKSGPVAQLGARFHGMEEVVGSIPTRSTKALNNLRLTATRFPKHARPALPSATGVLLLYSTTSGRMSCSSCSRMWQCQTYSFPPVLGLTALRMAAVGKFGKLNCIMTVAIHQGSTAPCPSTQFHSDRAALADRHTSTRGSYW